MNIRLLLSLLILVTFFACKTEEKKTEKSSNNTENTAETTQKENKVTTTKEVTLDDKITSIKLNFSNVEKLLSSLDKKIAIEDVGGGSTELEGYFDGKTPKKIKRSEIGGHGSTITTYYFKDDDLFFVFQEEYSEASVNGPFTGKETRYYVHKNELIRVLEKEKTVKSGMIDMSKVKNVDVTGQWKSKNDIVLIHKKIAQETSKQLFAVKIVGLDNGRWISTDDVNSGVEIKNGKFIMFYKGTETSPNSVYNYELSEKDGIEYLTLKNDAGEEMIYGLLEYSENSLVLSYLDRGNTLTYTKEK